MLERRLIMAGWIAAGLALLVNSSLHAQDTAPREPAVGLACAAEPAVVSDVSHPVLLRAWVTFGAAAAPRAVQAGQLHWHIDTGTLRGVPGDASRADWLFGSEPDGGSIGSRVAHAQAVWSVEGAEMARCDVRVRLPEARGGAIEPQREVLRSDRITARALMLPQQPEPKGYGLVGWILLPAPPRDEAERQRHREVVGAWLRELVPAEALLAHYERTSQIALTLLPLRSEVKLPEPGDSAERRSAIIEELLAAYDHARAEVVLADFDLIGRGRGPFLAARGDATDERSGSDVLLLDMSGVSTPVMSDWLVHFKWMAAQQRSWGQTAVRRLGLNLSNVLAATATATTLVLTATRRTHVFLLGSR